MRVARGGVGGGGRGPRGGVRGLVEHQPGGGARVGIVLIGLRAEVRITTTDAQAVRATMRCATTALSLCV